MTNRQNLWGTLNIDQPLRTPSTILKEQASLIGEMTNGLIIGEVISDSVYELVESYIQTIANSTKTDKNPIKVFRQTLRLKVPTLNHYTYSLLQITYPFELYPVILETFIDEQENPRRCENEPEFVEVLEKILSSEKVHQVIHVLLSQVI